jgi:nitrite reductase/ring-hydroxylating ferredoxin subunit
MRQGISSSATTNTEASRPEKEQAGPNLPGFVKALELSKLAPGTMTGVEVEGKQILLSNLGGQVYAVDGICTHEYSLLSQGFMMEDQRVVCQLHLSQFDLMTGEVYNPPATEPLKVYNVKIEEGTIFVELG